MDLFKLCYFRILVFTIFDVSEIKNMMSKIRHSKFFKDVLTTFSGDQNIYKHFWGGKGEPTKINHKKTSMALRAV